MKTRFKTKEAIDEGTNIDYFVVSKENFDKVNKLTIFSKNLHFPEGGVDHVYMTLEFDLKFNIIKIKENPKFIRLEKLKINKIVNLMNRRAKNLLKK